METPPDAHEGRHPIQVVARRTGLSPEVLRVWEKRYRVVTPSRTQTGRRLYSDGDIERLRLLRQATRAGRRISDLVGLERAELLDLVREDLRAEEAVPRQAGAATADVAAEALRRALDAVRALDGGMLDGVLARAFLTMGATALIEDVLAPLVEALGERWASGELGRHHEHLASAVVRRRLAAMIDSPRASESAPRIVVSTPAGVRHEIGAMFAAATAVAEGWYVIFLGPDLPAEDIADTAESRGAIVVALSIVYPAGDAQVATELRKLRELLRADLPIVVGGRAAGSYDTVLEEIGAIHLHDTKALRSILATFDTTRRRESRGVGEAGGRHVAKP